MSLNNKVHTYRTHSNIQRYKEILKGNLTFICSRAQVSNGFITKIFIMDGMNRIRKIIKSWYIRYLTSTELYMVEPWEKIFIHVLFVIIFALFWHFNSTIIVNGISQLRFSSSVEEMKS